MKTKIYQLLVAIMSVAALSGCDDWTPDQGNTYPDNTGGVSRATMDVVVNEAPSAIVGRAGVDTSDFLVTVTKSGSDEIASYNGEACSWTYSSMPQVFTLPVGDYTVTVRSHEPENAAWSAPYYAGSADFSVENNKVTAIGTVTCDFASVKVEVQFADDLASAMDETSHVDVVAGTAGTSLTWTAEETRYGYFYVTDNNPTLIATFTGNVKGQAVTAIKEITDVKAGAYYIISFSLKSGDGTLPPEYGDISGAGSGITIDYEIIESENSGTIKPGDDPIDPNENPDKEEWPDTPVNPDDPDPDDPDDPASPITIEYEGIDPDIINSITGDTYKLTFISQEPITNIEVEIISPYLTTEFLNSVGLTSKFDLAYPENSQTDPDDPNSEIMDLTDGLAGLEFPIGNAVIGQTEIPFDLSPFIPLLALDPNSGDIHIFRITIKDDKGNVKDQDLKFQN